MEAILVRRAWGGAGGCWWGSRSDGHHLQPVSLAASLPHVTQLGPTFTLKSERESCQTPPCQKYAAFAVNICKHTSAHTVLYTSSTPPAALEIQRLLSHVSSGCGKSFPPPLKDHFDSLARSPAAAFSLQPASTVCFILWKAQILNEQYEVEPTDPIHAEAHTEYDQPQFASVRVELWARSGGAARGTRRLRSGSSPPQNVILFFFSSSGPVRREVEAEITLACDLERGFSLSRLAFSQGDFLPPTFGEDLFPYKNK